MDYTVVIQSTIQELETIVKKLLRSGWKPLGGPHFNPLGNIMWYQAMIKEE
jgi:hypothetical protein